MILHFLEWKRELLVSQYNAIHSFIIIIIIGMWLTWAVVLYTAFMINKQSPWNILTNKWKNMLMYINQNRSIFFCVYIAMAGAVFIYKIHEKESNICVKRRVEWNIIIAELLLYRQKKKPITLMGQLLFKLCLVPGRLSHA